MLISRDLLGQPFGPGAGPDQHEEPIGGDRLALSGVGVAELEVLESPVPSTLDDFGAGAFVLELVDTFLGDAPALLETLRGALEDAKRLRRAAHTLKSNGRVFGAKRLAELCQELEAKAKAGSLAGAAELVARIDGEYARVERALRAAGREMT